MQPHVFGLETYFLFWLVAAVCGIAVGMRLARRGGFTARESFVALVVLAFSIFVGSKLLYLVEHVLFPYDDPVPMGQDTLGLLLWHGFRIPGGILLLAPTFPLVCRWLRLPTLRFADVVFPAAGIAVFCIRIGCLCNGCCFGGPTDFPLSMTFPPEARVYGWQVQQHLITAGAAQSLPVHPLQLYFALLGLLLYVLGVRWQEAKRFDGAVWAKFYLVFFSGTFALELLRPAPLHLNLILTSVVVAATMAIAARARAAVPSIARVTS